MSEHNVLTSSIPEFVHEQEHFAQLLAQPWNWKVFLVGVDRNLVIPSEWNLVDLTPYLEIVIPGDRAAGPQDNLSGRRLERRPDYVAGVPDGIDERMRFVAGTDISEMVGAVSLLVLLEIPLFGFSMLVKPLWACYVSNCSYRLQCG